LFLYLQKNIIAIEKPALIQGLWNKYVWSPRSLENPNTPINDLTITEILGGRKTRSGQSITSETALSISAVWACVRILGGIISYLPIKIYQKTADGRDEYDHKLSLVLGRNPNQYMNKVVFFDRMINHYSLWGNAYVEIIEGRDGYATSFNLLHPSQVDIIQDGYDVVYVHTSKNETRVIPSRLMVHVPNLGDDIVGKSVIRYAREDMGIELSATGYGADFFDGGTTPKEILIPKAPLKDKKQTDELLSAYISHKKSGKGTAVLPFGIDHKEVSGIPPEDAQFLQTRKFSVVTICRWFGVPPDKVYEMVQATYNNIEHQSISFLQDTISPIVAKIEAEFTRKLFSMEKDLDKYIEFNMDAYVRADSATKAELFKSGIQNGHMTPNEARLKQNLNKKEGGDDLLIQQNMTKLSLVGQQPQQNQKRNGKK